MRSDDETSDILDYFQRYSDNDFENNDDDFLFPPPYQIQPPQIDPPPSKPKNIMSFNEFRIYIHQKIDPNNWIKNITKEMYIKIEIPFIKEFGDKWIKLRRNDKRKKEQVLSRLYENVNLIYEKLEESPDHYLFHVNESIIKKYTMEQKK